MSSNEQRSSDAETGQPVGNEDGDRATSLPVLRSWRSVYVFVTGVFIVWVVLLTLLQRTFS